MPRTTHIVAVEHEPAAGRDPKTPHPRQARERVRQLQRRLLAKASIDGELPSSPPATPSRHLTVSTLASTRAARPCVPGGACAYLCRAGLMDAEQGDVRDVAQSPHEGQVGGRWAAAERRLPRAVPDEEDDDPRRAGSVGVDDASHRHRHGVPFAVVELCKKKKSKITHPRVRTHTTACISIDARSAAAHSDRGRARAQGWGKAGKGASAYSQPCVKTMSRSILLPESLDRVVKYGDVPKKSGCHRPTDLWECGQVGALVPVPRCLLVRVELGDGSKLALGHVGPTAVQCVEREHVCRSQVEASHVHLHVDGRLDLPHVVCTRGVKGGRPGPTAAPGVRQLRLPVDPRLHRPPQGVGWGGGGARARWTYWRTRLRPGWGAHEPHRVGRA